MSKLMIMLGFVIAAQLSVTYAANDDSLSTTEHEADGAKSLSMLLPEAEATKGISMFTAERNRSKFSDAAQSVESHPLFTADQTEFQELLSESGSLIHVDLSDPTLFSQFESSGIKILGGNGDQLPQALATYDGLPASHWFGDHTDTTFLLAEGSVQIVFPQNVGAVSLLVTTGDKEKLVAEENTILSFDVTLLDNKGLLVGQQSIQDIAQNGDPNFWGIVSNKPFRSIVISSDSSAWMFANLNYETEASEMK